MSGRAGFWLLGVLFGAGCASTHAEIETTPAAASAKDSNRARAEHLIAALAAGDPDAAARDFSPPMREAMPPPVLGALWRSLVAKNGAYQSFRFVASDHLHAKDRFSFELDFSQNSLPILVVLEPQSGQIIGLFSPPGKTARRAPPRPASDPRVDERALIIGAAASSPLGASLTLPKSRGEQRVPGVVFVQGSGPGDRDETLQRAKPFRDLAYGLAHRGVAALRFDKRTFAHPDSFDEKRSTVEEEVIADAVNAVQQLAAQPEVDPRRIFVVGHSLGGLLAPEIAERAGGVAGLVLLAAPGRPLPESMLEQLRIRGATPAALASLEAQVRALPNLPATETVLGVPAHYFQDLAKRDEVSCAIRLHVPVLYLRGELDQNVFALDQSNWAKALTSQVAFSQATLPGLNHHFLLAGADLASEPHVPDEVSARIAAFVLQ